MAYVKDKSYLSRILYIYGLKPLYVFGRFICILCNKCGGVPWLLLFLVMMKLVKFFATGTPLWIQSLFFSALPAPVPLYFDGVTLKR